MVFLVPGLFVLWMMTSLGLPDACEFANSNLEYIKGKIQEAVAAPELQMARYNTYKALNGIEKTKHNLQDCGCRSTQERMDLALSQLKGAARAGSLWESKQLLDQALENTLGALGALRDFRGGNPGPHDSRPTIDSRGQDWLFRIPDVTVREQVEESLSAFESSLESVIREVECEDARRFVADIYQETRSNLLNKELSKHKKEYYLRVRALTEQALKKLGDCGN